MSEKQPEGYSAAQIALHWLGAVLVIAAFATHDGMIAAAKAVNEGNYSGPDAVIVTHVVGGIIVFFLAVWRLGLLSSRGLPTPPEEEPAILRGIATLVKLLLYTIMIVMPVTGVLQWFGGVALARQIHVLMDPVVPLTVLLHLLGALYQQFWLKSGVLTRMLRPEPP
ncbi:MAG: cytochrome b [Alphaproteobacteria bacterium]